MKIQDLLNKIKINQTHTGKDQNIDILTFKIKLLIEKGKIKGHITYDELSNLPFDASFNIDQLEYLIDLFADLNISVIETKEEPKATNNNDQIDINEDEFSINTRAKGPVYYTATSYGWVAHNTNHIINNGLTNEGSVANTSNVLESRPKFKGWQ